jgi:hypothetical protein
MSLNKPIVQSLPPTQTVRDRLGNALREVELLRSLLKLAEKAERYRERDREIREEEGVARVD